MIKTGKPVPQLPGAMGAHNWQSMAFNPKTGLVYIPAQEVGMVYVGLPPKDFKLSPMVLEPRSRSQQLCLT